MIFYQQLHGYRQGHQLLSGSVKLAKVDQDLVDRLSDVAGPLRPGERFSPYLSLYPLPSMSHYVLARTWQDSDAPRAGCVRTRSLLVPMRRWEQGIELMDILGLLTLEGPLKQAQSIQAPKISQRPLPYVDAAQNVELVEALFLEERKPIVVFDATDSEATLIRLVTAFWPSFRRSFAASTFALSPRNLGDRSFDLVFSPIDARSRFSGDWAGRRIDAKKPGSARHRWTPEIIDRVFLSDHPSLLRDDLLGELSSQGGTEAQLRISLLFNELHERIDSSPNAALGLLDIVNSRAVPNLDVVHRLAPQLGSAAQRAAMTLPPSEAWRFLLALTDKLTQVRLKLSVAKAIRGSAVDLARRAPLDAVASAEMLATARGRDLLLGAVGDGVSQRFDHTIASAAAELDDPTFLQLVLLSPSFAATAVDRDARLLEKLAQACSSATQEIRDEARRRLLRLLVDDMHGAAARELFLDFDEELLMNETRLLHEANGLSSDRLRMLLVERARAIGSVPALRELCVTLTPTLGRDSLLRTLIRPCHDDLEWVLRTPLLPEEGRLDILRKLLGSATDAQFSEMIANLHGDIIDLLMRDPADNHALILRTIESQQVPAELLVRATLEILPYLADDRTHSLATRALAVALRHHTRLVPGSNVEQLLQVEGDRLNGVTAIRAALALDVPGEVVAANLSAFNRAGPAARRQLLGAVEQLAWALIGRHHLDIPLAAAEDAATLLWDSAAEGGDAFERASSLLLPFLLEQRRAPASPLIAVAFPAVYHRLRKGEQEPDLFSIFFFSDWDRCRTARKDLIRAFMRSDWRASDIALAAARAEDAATILRLIAERPEGSRVLTGLYADLNSIPVPWRHQVAQALAEISESKDF
ncbi:hypothetical protein SAMN05444679_103119 [Variovorax sp. CF079]|uniref:GAP1-N1 domain-containing protein n=1 Tax=Variovorax sp. CF079 TaxID=1882774 RepID=UPI00088E33EC|nr:hypothetical protein [Variovorax sp. CF079]SDC45789.1 hypothetical protein SAMN05444679_103119 [Variovorax sp. CF079]